MRARSGLSLRQLRLFPAYHRTALLLLVPAAVCTVTLYLRGEAWWLAAPVVIGGPAMVIGGLQLSRLVERLVPPDIRPITHAELLELHEPVLRDFVKPAQALGFKGLLFDEPNGRLIMVNDEGAVLGVRLVQLLSVRIETYLGLGHAVAVTTNSPTVLAGDRMFVQLVESMNVETLLERHTEALARLTNEGLAPVDPAVVTQHLGQLQFGLASYRLDDHRKSSIAVRVWNLFPSLSDAQPLARREGVDRQVARLVLRGVPRSSQPKRELVST